MIMTIQAVLESTMLSMLRLSAASVVVAFAACRGEIPVNGTTGPATLTVVDSLHLNGVGTINELQVEGDSIFVLDSRSRRIHVVSSGQIVDSFGGSGEGPGEFIFPAGMAVTPNGSVYVSDPPLARISRFERDSLGHYQFADVVHVSSAAPVVALDFIAEAGHLLGLREREPLVGVFDDDGVEVHSFGTMSSLQRGSVDSDGHISHLSGKMKLAIAGDEIVTIYNVHPIVRVYDARRVLRDSFEVEIPNYRQPQDQPFVRSADAGQGWLMKYTLIHDLFATQSNLYVVGLEFDKDSAAAVYHVTVVNRSHRANPRHVRTTSQPWGLAYEAARPVTYGVRVAFKF